MQVAFTCEMIAAYLLWTSFKVTVVLFAAACATFLALTSRVGGIDQVILQHAETYPQATPSKLD